MIEISATLNNAEEFEKVLLAAAEEYGPRNAVRALQRTVKLSAAPTLAYLKTQIIQED